MKATNIYWDIDIEEAYEKLDNMTSAQAAEALNIPEETYANMSTSERHDYAYDSWHHHRTLIDEFMGLPDEIEIPEGMTDDEEISDWLSDEYGFCHEGFLLVE